MNENETKQLSRTDLFSMAIGQIIGVGIMTMTGIAIGFTGRSVNLAYLVAGLITIFAAIPQIYIGGTANFYGGQYSQIGVLCGQKAAGIFCIFNCLHHLRLVCIRFRLQIIFCHYFQMQMQN